MLQNACESAAATTNSRLLLHTQRLFDAGCVCLLGALCPLPHCDAAVSITCSRILLFTSHRCRHFEQEQQRWPTGGFIDCLCPPPTPPHPTSLPHQPPPPASPTQRQLSLLWCHFPCWCVCVCHSVAPSFTLSAGVHGCCWAASAQSVAVPLGGLCASRPRRCNMCQSRMQQQHFFPCTLNDVLPTHTFTHHRITHNATHARCSLTVWGRGQESVGIFIFC